MLAKELAEILLRYPEEKVIVRYDDGTQYRYFEVSELDYCSGLTANGWPLKICFSVTAMK